MQNVYLVLSVGIEVGPTHGRFRIYKLYSPAWGGGGGVPSLHRTFTTQDLAIKSVELILDLVQL